MKQIISILAGILFGTAVYAGVSASFYKVDSVSTYDDRPFYINKYYDANADVVCYASYATYAIGLSCLKNK